MYNPNYTITDALLNLISQIEAIRNQVSAARILPAREAELRYRATVEATHSSTSIEGNPLNYQQVEKTLSEPVKLSRRQYYEIEVKNYKRALDYIDKRKNSRRPITENDILRIHKILTERLLDGTRSGIWRQHSVYIENQSGEKMYDGAEVWQIEPQISNLLAWLTQKSYGIHPVIAAAALHWEFVSIHPFADGNGRTARVLTILYLGMRNYDFRGALVLDSYYSTDKPAYYKALHDTQGSNYKTSQAADLTPWIQYFAEGFLASAHVLSAEVALISTALASAPARKISRDEMDILSYIEQFGSLTISEAEEILHGVSKRTIQRRLKRLIDEGFICSEGSTNNVRYIKKC